MPDQNYLDQIFTVYECCMWHCSWICSLCTLKQENQLHEYIFIYWEMLKVNIVDLLRWLSWRWTDPGPAWPLLQVLKKDSQEFVARSYWDVLRRSASQVLFSDLAEVHRPNCPLSLHPSILHLSLFLLSSPSLIVVLVVVVVVVGPPTCPTDSE